MRRRTPARDPIPEWFGEGTPGWIAGISGITASVCFTLAYFVMPESDFASGILALAIPAIFLAVSVPVLVVDAVVSAVGRSLGWRVGEVMVAIPLLWVVTLVVRAG